MLFDGYQAAALQLMTTVNPSTSSGPSNRLLKLMQLGLSISDG